MSRGSDVLEKEFEFYLANQDEMVDKYDGKVVAITGGVVVGVYDSELAAVTDLRKTNKLGTVLVQKVTAGASAYTYTFRSLVGFP